MAHLVQCEELPVAHHIGFSPFESLARAVCGSHWRKALFLMMHAYFDCSQSGQGNGVLVVAGWLSSGERWLRFEADWRSVLDEFNVPHFHMKEFAHSVGAFTNGWKGENDKRELFIRSLLSVIYDHAMASFSCMVENSVFAAVNQEYQLREYFGNEYALCSRVCVAEVNKWIRAHGYPMPPEYVFEDGDERGRLNWLMESQGYPPPIYKPGRDRTAKDGTLIPGFLQLQAADFAAYELRKGWDDFGETKEISRYRKSFLAVGKVVGEGFWGRCTEDDLRQICIGLGVPKR